MQRYFPDSKVKVIRADSFSSFKSQERHELLAKMLIHAEFTPPGQHAYNDVERWWYTLLLGAVIAMRQGRAPYSMWFKAMEFALDAECTNVQRIHGEKLMSGFERATGERPNTRDRACFYAPGRFALDKGQLPHKWAERARAGFYCGRVEEFVWMKKQGAACWWDGNVFRVVVNNYYVYEHSFANPMATDNKLLPSFPNDENPIPTAVPPIEPLTLDGTKPTSGDVDAAKDVSTQSADAAADVDDANVDKAPDAASARS